MWSIGATHPVYAKQCQGTHLSWICMLHNRNFKAGSDNLKRKQRQKADKTEMIIFFQLIVSFVFKHIKLL